MARSSSTVQERIGVEAIHAPTQRGLSEVLRTDQFDSCGGNHRRCDESRPGVRRANANPSLDQSHHGCVSRRAAILRKVGLDHALPANLDCPYTRARPGMAVTRRVRNLDDGIAAAHPGAGPVLGAERLSHGEHPGFEVGADRPRPGPHHHPIKPLQVEAPAGVPIGAGSGRVAGVNSPGRTLRVHLPRRKDQRHVQYQSLQEGARPGGAYMPVARPAPHVRLVAGCVGRIGSCSAVDGRLGIIANAVALRTPQERRTASMGVSGRHKRCHSPTNCDTSEVRRKAHKTSGAGNRSRTYDLRITNAQSQKEKVALSDAYEYDDRVKPRQNQYSRAQTLSHPLCSFAAVKTHDSLPRGADRLKTTNGRERTAATNLPEIDRGSECPVVAHSTGNSHDLLIPAPKGGCALVRTRQRLASDIGQSWVKQVSPQSACMP